MLSRLVVGDIHLLGPERVIGLQKVKIENKTGESTVIDTLPAQGGQPAYGAMAPHHEFEHALMVGETGYWELAPENKRFVAAAAVDRMFGFEPNSPRPLDAYLERVHAADQSVVKAVLRDRPAQFRVEARITPHDRPGTVWLVVQGEKVQTDSTAPARFVGTICDISSLKHSEALLHDQAIELEARVRELNCLYSVSRLVQRYDDLETLLRQAIAKVPDGFRLPNTVGVRLVWHRSTMESPGFTASENPLCEELLAQGKVVGRIEVHRQSTAYPTGFTAAEKALLQALRKPIGRAIEREEVLAALSDSENRWRTLAESLAEGLLVYDEQGRVSAWNRSAEQMLSIPLEKGVFSGRIAGTILSEDGSVFPEADYPTHTTRNTGDPCNGIVMGLPREDGSTSWLSINTRALKQPGGTPPYPVVASFIDITGRKHSERERALLAAIVKASPDAIASTDLDGKITSWNTGAERMYGYRADEIIGKSISVIMPPECQDELSMILAAIAKGEGVTYFDSVRMNKAGERVDVSVAVTPITDNEGRVSGAAKIDRNISERKRMEEQLQHDAFHDRLTGVANRSLFMDRLEHVVARAGRFGESFAIFVMDMDNFKLINDSFGHLVGDQLLCAFVERIQSLLRPVDTLARFGGDEFTLLLEETEGKAAVEQIASRILGALEQPFQLGQHEIKVSSSIGIVLDETACQSADQAVRNADVALYEAKRQGKNQYVVFDARMRGEEVSRMYLESELRLALQQDHLTVQFQPIVDLNDGEPVGCEALARWKHDVMGRVDTARFITVAEDTGLITPLGRFVLEKACATLGDWLKRPEVPQDFYVSVNVSPKEFYSGDLVPFVGAMLDKYNLRGANLRLEITENVVIQHDREAAAILGQIQVLGVKTCLDDFGTGYSSLSYLQQLPFDVIKVDRSFIQGVSDRQQSREILRAVLGLAKALGMDVVAEGAESPEQLAEIRALGFRWGQGYGLFHPMDRSKLASLLTQPTSADP